MDGMEDAYQPYLTKRSEVIGELKSFAKTKLAER